MGILGNLLSLPVSIINVVPKSLDAILTDGELGLGDPLEKVAKEIKKVDE